MIGIDTNILLRFAVNDDPRQSKKVKDLFIKAENSREKIFISSSVIFEGMWALEKKYLYEIQDILALFDHLLDLEFLEIENYRVLAAMVRSQDPWKLDLADAFIGFAGMYHECDTTYTFDKKAAKHSPNFTLL